MVLASYYEFLLRSIMISLKDGFFFGRSKSIDLSLGLSGAYISDGKREIHIQNFSQNTCKERTLGKTGNRWLDNIK